MKTKISAQNNLSGRLKTRHGFTLTEMLVVVAIIAVLAVIGSSYAGAMFRTAHTAVCVQNLKTISGAMILYTVDHESNFPIDLGYDANGNNINWMSQISGYGVTWKPSPPEDDVWYCPEADPNSADRVGWGGPSYGANDQLCPVMDLPTSVIALRKMVQVTKPSTTMMIWDSAAQGNPLSGHWKGVGNRWLMEPWPLVTNGDYGEGAPAPRHRGTGVQTSSFITSFCDGHVEVIAPNDPRIQTATGRSSLTVLP